MSPFPQRFIAGDTITFTESDSEYPAPTYTAGLSIKSETGAVLTFASTQNGTDHLFTLPGTLTAQLVTGNAIGTFYMVDENGNRTTRHCQPLYVVPDPTQPTPQSPTQIQLANLDAVITQLTSSTAQSASFNGQSFTNKDLNQLYAMQTNLQAKLFREQITAKRAQGIDPKMNVSQRFRPTAAGPFGPSNSGYWCQNP